METYIQSHCKHQDLFQATFQHSWLDERFLRALKLLKSNSPHTTLVDEGLLEEIFPNVYSLPVFTPLICNMIIEETEHFLQYAAQHDLEVYRPNSMNKYGLVLNQMGLLDLLTDLQQTYLLDISRSLYPREVSDFTNHHSFVVSYSPDTDRALDMHTDDSDVTWNVCLGREGFVGSGLTFCGVMAQAGHRQLQGKYSHRVGHAVVHLGHQRHGADEIASGERHNLIMWSKNDVYRQSAEFQQAMRIYHPESGPPHPLCLSHTHDRDYLAFKEYPEGSNPYRNLFLQSESEGGGGGEEEGGRKMSLPWCPPPRLGYEGMLSHNKLMRLHYERECEREDREERKSESRERREREKVRRGEGGGRESKGQDRRAGEPPTP